MLADEGKHQSDEIVFKREPREQPFVKRGGLRQQSADSDFNPSQLTPLSGVVQAR